MRNSGADRAKLDGGGGAAGARIWALGGGKGGVGKSVLTSSLAIAVARGGARCALVDVDLGGANQHTLLGGCAPKVTLGQFLGRQVARLEDVMAATRFPNLWLVSGARVPIEVANLKHQQKAKLLRHIRGLPVDHVFLDLSAGSAFNTLDFFLAAARGIAVVVPEPTAIENTYHFLKAAYFRSLRAAARREDVREAIEKALEGGARVGSPRELLARVEAVDPEAGALLREEARRFAPLVVVNQARTLAHRSLGREIALAARRHLGTRVGPLGACERDECVREAVRQQVPVLERFPGCPFSLDVAEIATRLVDGSADALDAEPRLAIGGPLRRRRDPLVDHGLEPDEPRPVAPPGPASVRRTAASGAPGNGSWTASRPSGPPPDRSHPGAFLRHRRERLGLALTDLARRTRIRNLERLEDERFDALPPEPYVRGYVLQYARALGIPHPETLAAQFVLRYRQAAATAKALD